MQLLKQAYRFGAAALAAALLLAAPAQAACRSCGTIISQHTYERPAAHGSGAGAVGGALVGGLLGNQVGKGNGRTLATVAGAVGGGFAGNAIEKRMHSRLVTRVAVRMGNGRVRTVTEAGASHWANGAHVRIVHNRLVAV